MKMFEALLLYIRATRQRLWDLHLASTHNLAKYYFVHDKHNYARMIPVYLAEMISLKDNDPDTWKFFEDGNFSVNKTKISFSGIGCDHAIEHENRAMKVAGGITGIYHDPQLLERFFLTCPELNTICEDFSNLFFAKIKQKKRRASPINRLF